MAFLQSVVVIVFVAGFGMFASQQVRETYAQQLQRQVKDIAEVLFQQFPKTFYPEWCNLVAVGTGFRLSVIDAQTGKILCDNQYDLKDLPLVLDRPEIQAALASPNRRGESIRPSRLFNNLPRLYSTVYMPEQQLVLRTGFSFQGIDSSLLQFERMLVFVGLSLMVLLVLVIQLISRGYLFRKTKKMMEEANTRMQEDLIANVSHEFRTPLSSIMGFVHTMKKNIQEDRRIDPEHLDIVHKDSERLLTMVNELLEIASLDAHSIHLNLESIDTRDITEEALARLNKLYEDKKHRVLCRFDSHQVFGDPQYVLQILNNLIGNSMKYCPTETEILVSWYDKDKSTILRVQDRGPGIPEENYPLLFQRFQRFQVNAKDVKGTGLGLAIVKGLAELHGGWATVLPKEPGLGLGFEIYFPRESEALSS